jgi:hypothetical protein
MACKTRLEMASGLAQLTSHGLYVKLNQLDCETQDTSPTIAMELCL